MTDLPGEFTKEDAPVVSCSTNGGEFLVTWQGSFTDANNIGVVGAFLELNAAPQGDFFSIFAPSVGIDLRYGYPGLAFGGYDHVLVAWESDRPPDGSVEDTRGRFVGNRLFADGFESGSQIFWVDPDP